MSTRELVDALVSGDSVSIESNFNDAMAEKISSALDSYRVQIAQNIFPKTEVAEVEQTEDADVSEA